MVYHPLDNLWVLVDGTKEFAYKLRIVMQRARRTVFKPVWQHAKISTTIWDGIKRTIAKDAVNFPSVAFLAD